MTATQLKAAAPYLFQGSSDARDLAVTCLAAAAWYESGSDPAGQKSVIQVVLNRMRHASFPNSACGVVFQGSKRATGCQFTFTCDGSLRRRFPGAKAWESARLRAQAALDGQVDSSVSNATHFHADYVAPWWSSKLERLSKVGRHIFYRWPGKRSMLSATGTAGSLDADRAIVASFAGGDITRRPQSSPYIALDVGAASNSDTAFVELSTGGITRTVEQTGSRAAPANNSHFSLADSSEPSGRWAVEAMNRCAGNNGCVVISYPTGASLSRNKSLPISQRDRPIFIFVRDPASGMDLALWDCSRIDRPNPDQCLPTSDASLRRLMAINKG